jgi:hypothetical protein
MGLPSEPRPAILCSKRVEMRQVLKLRQLRSRFGERLSSDTTGPCKILVPLGRRRAGQKRGFDEIEHSLLQLRIHFKIRDSSTSIAAV